MNEVVGIHHKFVLPEHAVCEVYARKHCENGKNVYDAADAGRPYAVGVRHPVVFHKFNAYKRGKCDVDGVDYEEIRCSEE